MFVEKEAAWLQITAVLDLSVSANTDGYKLGPRMMTTSSSCLVSFPIVHSTTPVQMLLLQRPTITRNPTYHSLTPASGLIVEEVHATPPLRSRTPVYAKRVITICSIPPLSHATKNVQLDSTVQILDSTWCPAPLQAPACLMIVKATQQAWSQELNLGGWLSWQQLRLWLCGSIFKKYCDPFLCSFLWITSGHIITHFIQRTKDTGRMLFQSAVLFYGRNIGWIFFVMYPLVP